MAENNDEEALKSVTVISQETFTNVGTVRSDTDIDSETNNAADSVSLVRENAKKVQFDSVNLDDISGSEEYTDDDGDDEDDDDGVFKDNKQKRKRLKKKKPKHVVIDDESSSDDETKTTNDENINPSDLTWMLWMWYYVRAVSSGALRAAEFVGEKLASFFGITTPKYQYVIDEYYRLKELEKEEEENERKEQEFVAERKMAELSKMEGGSPEFVYNQVSSSVVASNTAIS